MGTVLVLSLLALLALTSTHAGLMDRLDLHKYRAIRDFREPRTGAWVYTAALKKGASARQLYAGLTASISSLKKHNTKWPVVVIVGDGIGEEFTQVLKALDVDQVLEVDRDILPHHRRSGQVIDAANAKVTDQYYGCFNKLWAWTLTQYEKVILLDWDVIIWRNPDDAMLYPELSAINDYGMSIENPSEDWHKAFQAGIMVLEPYNKTFLEISHLLAQHLERGDDLGGLPEQHILNEFFNLRWFELPVGFNILPFQIPGGVYRGIYSLHHVGPRYKEDFSRTTHERCEQEAECHECCRRAVDARNYGLEKLEAAGLIQHYHNAHG